MEENAVCQTGQLCIIALAEAVVSLGEKNIICTWVGFNRNGGGEVVRDYLKKEVDNAINRDCRDKSYICKLIKNNFTDIAGNLTCWNCDFRQGGIDSETKELVYKRLKKVSKEEINWKEEFRPIKKVYESGERPILFLYEGEQNQENNLLNDKGGGSMAAEKESKGGKGSNLRSPRHELRIGDRKEDLGKISTLKAAAAAQARANELGVEVRLWKYVVSRKEWSELGTFKPGAVSAVVQKKAGKASIKVAAENKSLPVLPAFGGFDVLASDEDSSGPKKFFIVRDSLGSKITGGYLGEEDAGLAQGFIDGLSKIFPGSINLTEIYLTDNQMKEMINFLLRLTRVKEEKGEE